MKKILFALGIVVQLCFCNAWAQTGPNYSDLWWNQNESGWGMMLNHQGDTIFAPWYTYGVDGKARWYTVQVTRQADGSYAGPIGQTTGVPLNLINGQASLKSTTTVGNATLRFANNNAGTFAFTIGNVTQTKAISRQQYTTTATTCSLQPTAATSRATSQNYQDLWWVPLESGWGVNIAHQGDILFVAWFTYAADGSAQWLFGSNVKRQADGSYAGELYRATGTPFAQINGQPSLLSAPVVGNISFRFNDGEQGVMTYSVEGVSGSKNIVRQVFGSTVSVCTNPSSTVTSNTPPASGGSCLNALSLNAGNFYEYRSTVAATGNATFSRQTVIGPGTFSGTAVTIVEIRNVVNGVLATDGYARLYYQDRGATIGVIGSESFNGSGGILATTTYSPVDYGPKIGTVGQTYAGAFKATAISSAGGFGTTATVDYSYSVTLTAMENVTVPAGSFSACRGELSRFSSSTTVAVNGLPVGIPGGGSSFSCSGTGNSHIASIGNVRSFTDTTTCTGASAPGASRVTTELVRASVDGKAFP